MKSPNGIKQTLFFGTILIVLLLKAAKFNYCARNSYRRPPYVCAQMTAIEYQAAKGGVPGAHIKPFRRTKKNSKRAIYSLIVL